MHSVHATTSGLADERKCESVSSAEICKQKRKLRSDKISNKFFHIPSRKSLELERTGKSDSDSEPQVFLQFHDRPDIKQDRKTISWEKAQINRPFSDSQITITSSYPEYREYRTHISSPESESSEEANFSDLGEYLIAANKADLEELEQLETEIILARFGPIPLAQQPLAAQAPANAQMFFPAVNMLLEERMLCPTPFSGRADEDATEFWRRFQNYLEFKPIVADADKLRLIKAMCIDQAADWAEKLEPNERATFNAFKQAFGSCWVKPALL